MTRLSVLLAVVVLGATPLKAQEATQSPFTWRNIVDRDEIIFVGSVAAGSLALHQVDESLMLHAQDSMWVERALLAPLATPFNLIGRPGTFVVASAAFLAGRISGEDGLENVGLHSVAALALNEGATRLIKGVVGRARPSLSPDPGDFSLGSGFGNSERGAFPSGHTSSAFALAAVLQSEFSRRSSDYHIPVATVVYGTAAGVGLARIFDNRHWATDVLGGAALGYLIGENVVEFAYRNETGPPEAVTGERKLGLLSQLPPIPLFHFSIPTR